MITGESFEEIVNDLEEDISVRYIIDFDEDPYWEILLDFDGEFSDCLAKVYVDELDIYMPTAGYTDVICSMMSYNRMDKYPSYKEIDEDDDLIEWIYNTLTEEQLFEEILIAIRNAFCDRARRNNEYMEDLNKTIKNISTN